MQEGNTMQLTQPMVSVIVPVYKVERYLEQCLVSIVHQSYRHLEILLVDDGSPDNCPQLCDMWAQRDSRIHVIHKPNGGLSDARNAGLRQAHGDLVAFVDSDDWLALDMIEKNDGCDAPQSGRHGYLSVCCCLCRWTI